MSERKPLSNGLEENMHWGIYKSLQLLQSLLKLEKQLNTKNPYLYLELASLTKEKSTRFLMNDV